MRIFLFRRKKETTQKKEHKLIHFAGMSANLSEITTASVFTAAQQHSKGVGRSYSQPLAQG